MTDAIILPLPRYLANNSFGYIRFGSDAVLVATLEKDQKGEKSPSVAYDEISGEGIKSLMPGTLTLREERQRHLLNTLQKAILP